MKARSWGKGAALLLSALLFLLFAAGPAQAADVYKVTLSRTGTMGLTTDCSAEGYILAHFEKNYLKADGTDLEANGDLGPELQINIGSDVAWTRKYDVGKGLSGVFDACFGETDGPNGFSGAMFIFFESGKGPNGKSTVRFTWHFDYYVTSGNTTREHFTLSSGKIPFAAWTGGNLSGTVKGTFDLKYYLKEGRTIISSYESLTGGQGREFEFVLTIEKVQ
jgi:hypothetical protein